jgi:hypothetical protein
MVVIDIGPFKNLPLMRTALLRLAAVGISISAILGPGMTVDSLLDETVSQRSDTTFALLR